ncbi:MAG: hypothetical protein ACSHXY_10745 [Alphaproteobacteria bacterium]
MTPQTSNSSKHDTWDYVEKELHGKLSTEDAWQMAQNLGHHIAQTCGRSSPQKRIRQTFISAFGYDIGESKIKNRTRWVVLPMEVKGREAKNLKSNEIAKTGGDFKQIAKALLPTRPDYLAMLVKGTSIEPPYLKVPVTDNSGLDLIESVCDKISKKHNLIEYYRALINFGVGWKQYDPSSTDAETLARAIPRIVLNEPILHNDGEKGKLAKAKKYNWPTGFSVSSAPSIYSKMDEILPNMYEEYDFRVTAALAPTIFLGNLYLPIPLFKVRLPNDMAAARWRQEKKGTSFSEEFKREFSRFSFFDEQGDGYDDFGDGILIHDFYFKYEHKRKEFNHWQSQISQQDGNYNIGFAVGYSPHQVCLMLLPNSDGNKVSPHILISGSTIVGEADYAAFLSKAVKSDWYNGNRDIFLTDEGRTCFFHMYDTNEWENVFQKLSSLINTGFPASSRSGKSVLNQKCDNQGAWLTDVGLNELFDKYNPTFYPSFEYDTDSFANSPTTSIIGKLHRHLLSKKPEDCILSELDDEAKAFTENLEKFLKGHLQKKAVKEADLKSYFE